MAQGGTKGGDIGQEYKKSTKKMFPGIACVHPLRLLSKKIEEGGFAFGSENLGDGHTGGRDDGVPRRVGVVARRTVLPADGYFPIACKVNTLSKQQ